MTTQILEIDSLRKTYGKGNNQTKALNGITFQVMAGEFLGIMGSSGSGKSTLLNCIATVIRPTGGRIRMRETDVHSLRGADLAEYRGKKIGYLFQSFELLDNLTGRENILLPLSLHGVPAKESRERLQSLSDYLEITDVLDKFPALRELGDHFRNAMSQILEVALLVGGFTASGAIMNEVGMSYIGSMIVMIVWMMNKCAKKPFLIPMAVGPVVTIAMGFVANLIKVLGLSLI